MSKVKKAFRSWISEEPESLAFIQFVHYEDAGIDKFELTLADCFRNLGIKIDSPYDPSLNKVSAVQELGKLQDVLVKLGEHDNWLYDKKKEFDTGIILKANELKQFVKVTTMVDTEENRFKLYITKEYTKPELVVESAIIDSLIMLHCPVTDDGFIPMHIKLNNIAQVVRKSRDWVISCF